MAYTPPNLGQAGAMAGAMAGQGMGNFISGAMLPDSSAPGDTGQPATIADRLFNGMNSAQNGGIEKVVAQANQAKALRSVIGAYADAMPDEDQAAALKAKSHVAGLGELEGMVQGFAVQQQQQLNASKIADYQSQIQERQDKQDLADQEAGGLARWAQTMDGQINGGATVDHDSGRLMPADEDNEAEPADGGASPMADFTPQQRQQFHAIAQMGAANPRLAAPLLRNLFQQFGPGASKTANGGADQDNVPGIVTLGDQKIPVIYSKKGGQFQIDPGYKAGSTAEAKAANTPAEEEPGDGPKLDKSGKFYYDAHLKSWKPVSGAFGTASRIEEILGGPKTGAATAPAAAPAAKSEENGPLELPKTKGKIDPSKMEKGKVYQTSRGPAVWDGKQFTKAQ